MDSITDGHIQNYKDYFAKMVCSPAFTWLLFFEVWILSWNWWNQEDLGGWIWRKPNWNNIFLLVDFSWPVQLLNSTKICSRICWTFLNKFQVIFVCFYETYQKKLSHSEVAIVCDFSENYSFFYMKHNHCTGTILRLLVTFLSFTSKKHRSFFVVLDSRMSWTQHGGCSFVSEKTFNDEIKISLFFGRLSCHKSKQNILNLCNHENI